MALNNEDKAKLLEVLERTGLKRGAAFGDVVVPDFYLAYLDQVKREAVTIDCPAVNVPVTCYISIPRDKADNCSVHINIHGGGFYFTHYDMDDMYCARIACETRGIVVDIDYATTTDYAFPVAFEQCYAAMKWTFSQCASWHADPARVSIGGQSAGGALTAAVCLRSTEDRDMPGKLAMQILNFAGLNMSETLESTNERFRTFGMLYADGDPQTLNSAYASPSLASDAKLKGQPPAVIMTAGQCPFKEADLEYGMRLVAMGNEVTFRSFVNSRHAFTIVLADEWQESQEFIVRCINSQGA